ncbi:hypothetical protein [Microbulbifer magnicolonia]|uniref:hypothetical protein n=1 Tax=Microbulbifer magnicolonia TaxID=3109744 RepID=UPI002B407C39|nr:hypothetical protein [Microbulbifer sp. GG15]
MRRLKAKIGSMIDIPADALRSMVIDAGLTRAMQMRTSGAGACGNKVTRKWLLENELPLAALEQP